MTKKLDLATGRIINVNDHARIATKIRDSIWLITPEGLNAVLDIASRRLSGETFSDEYLEQIASQSNSTQDGENNFEIKNGLGILPIMGPIFGKANLMTQLSGATSLEVLQSDFRQLLNDDSVHSILLNIDSPGGTSDLVQEMGAEIFAGRDIKPIHAIANTSAGSAAYWLMSQAEQLYSTPSGSVGSVGAYTVHEDQSVRDEQQGNKYTFISAGPYKVEGNPHEPLSDEGREFRQERIDELYGDFVGAIANGRGVTTEQVKAMYGGGRMLSPNKALAAGMIDNITPYEDLVNQLSRPSAPTFRTGKGGENVNRDQLLEFAQSLNVSVADTDTDEQIHQKCLTAVSSLNSELAPLRELKSATVNAKSFAEQYPEQAQRMARLEKENLEASSLKFSENYSRFWKEDAVEGQEAKRTSTTNGFTALAKGKISDFHMALVEHEATVESFGEILDLVASGKGIVEYASAGSSRRTEHDGEENQLEEGLNARQVFHELTKKVAARPENKEKDFKEIFSLTAKEFPKEHEAWQRPLIAAGGGN